MKLNCKYNHFIFISIEFNCELKDLGFSTPSVYPSAGTEGRKCGNSFFPEMILVLCMLGAEGGRALAPSLYFGWKCVDENRK